jgi:tight adherence protein B
VTVAIAALALAIAVLLIGRRAGPLSRLGAAGHVATRPATQTAAPTAAQASSAWRALHVARRRNDATEAAAATVEAVFALAAELRAGRPPGLALTLVSANDGVLSEPLLTAAAAVVAGGSAADELLRVAEVPGCAGFRGVAAAWRVTEDSGGAVADVLDRLGEVLDAEEAARAALSAALAGPRATMLLLAGLPLIGLALGQSLGAQPLRLLVHRPLGWALLAGAGVFDAIGVGWTRLLVRRALR